MHSSSKQPGQQPKFRQRFRPKRTVVSTLGMVVLVDVVDVVDKVAASGRLVLQEEGGCLRYFACSQMVRVC